MEYSYRDELYHHGIKGQKWGVRRYQNEDGTLTSAGKKRKTTAKDYYGEGRKTTAEQYNRRTKDKGRFGEKGYERITKKLDKGKSYNSAVSSEIARNAAKRALVTIGALAIVDLTINKGKGIKTNIDVAKTIGIAAKMQIGKRAAEKAAWKAAHTVWDVDLNKFVTI